MSEKKFQVGLMGAAFHTGNMGVAALAASMIKIISGVKPNSVFSFYISHNDNMKQSIILNGQKNEIDVYNYRLSPKSKLNDHIFWIVLLAVIYRLTPIKAVKNIVLHNRFLKNLHNSDIILDIRGGDSFSDIYGKWYYIIESLPRICVLLIGKKYILMPQTYGPYKSLISKKIASLIFKRSALIFSRDQEGITAVKKLLPVKQSNKIHFCPDVAFLLDARKPVNISIDPPIDKKNELIGLNISGLLYQKTIKKDIHYTLSIDYERFINILIEQLIKSTKAHILICPHTYGVFESDYLASKEIFKKLPDAYKKRVHIISDRYDQSEIKGIIGSCGFFIGSRMHSCIAALSQGIPAVGFAYSKKFLGVFQTIGMDDLVIDANIITPESAVEKITALYNIFDAKRRKNLVRDVNEVKKNLASSLEIIFK